MTTDIDRTDGTLAIPEDHQPGKSIQAARWNELFNLAKLISGTEIVPKPLRGRPDAIFAVMASAEERGISPLTGLQNIDLIDGRPAPSAMLQRSMIQRAGHVLVWRRADHEAAILYGRRKDSGSDFEAVFTIDDAKAMKLTGKGNWATMPRAMLMARVTSLLGRMLFADVLLGMAYTPEELGQVGPYAAIDLEYDPDQDRHMRVDPETGEIMNMQDEDDARDLRDDDRREHIVQADIFDAEDEQDAAWLRAAKGEPGGDDQELEPLIEGQFDRDEPYG
jgi:hypothetical protein